MLREVLCVGETDIASIHSPKGGGRSGFLMPDWWRCFWSVAVVAEGRGIRQMVSVAVAVAALAALFTMQRSSFLPASTRLLWEVAALSAKTGLKRWRSISLPMAEAMVAGMTA